MYYVSVFNLSIFSNDARQSWETCHWQEKLPFQTCTKQRLESQGNNGCIPCQNWKLLTNANDAMASLECFDRCIHVWSASENWKWMNAVLVAQRNYSFMSGDCQRILVRRTDGDAFGASWITQKTANPIHSVNPPSWGWIEKSTITISD